MGTRNGRYDSTRRGFYSGLAGALLLSVLWGPSGGAQTDANELQYRLNLQRFADCSQVERYVHKQLQSFRDYHEYWEKVVRPQYPGIPIVKAVASDAAEAAASPSTAADDSMTNVQEQGVDEADFVKRNAAHLYVLHETDLEVYERQTLQSLGTIRLDGFRAHQVGDRRITQLEMYAYGQRLVLLGPAADRREGYLVQVYRAQSGGFPARIREFRLTGSYVDSRLIDGYLYLVLGDHLGVNPYDYADRERPLPSRLVTTSAGMIGNVPCDQLIKPTLDDLDFSITKLFAIDLAKPRLQSRTALLGASSEIYMSKSHVYVIKKGYYWHPWRPIMGKIRVPRSNTVISRFNVANEKGAIYADSHGLVRGWIKDRWSLKELADESLAVASTTAQPIDRGELANIQQDLEVGRNHLWLLKKRAGQLRHQAAIINFGEPGEDIRAMRYVGTKAYVVTFKKTDPLYAFDLQDPAQPRLLGKLKIPGFSTYMHPIGDNLMIGLGFDAVDMGDFAYYQGIQLSLFDVSDPENPRRIDERVFGDRGSYSDATANPHGFFYDAANQLIGFPLVELTKSGDPATSEPWAYGDELRFSGAVLYTVADVAGEPRLQEVTRLTHQPLMTAGCLEYVRQARWWTDQVDSYDINRIVQHEGRMLAVSRFGLQAYQLGESPILQTTSIFSSRRDCRAQ
jgi:uncharacterized secreted protein with C-terminal beta-propeller domain